MTNYRRNYIQGGYYFFTVVLNDRKSDLLIRYINELRAAFSEVKRRHPFEIIAIVVLPEHLHCILRLPEGDDDFSLRLRQVKANFSRKLPKIERISASRKKKQERGIWQRRFWEHSIRDDEGLNRHIEYIYFNPVKHELVDYVADWEYSSFHRDVKKGLFTNSWLGNGDDLIDVGEVIA